MARLNKLDCEYTLEEAKNVDANDITTHPFFKKHFSGMQNRKGYFNSDMYVKPDAEQQHVIHYLTHIPLDPHHESNLDHATHSVKIETQHYGRTRHIGHGRGMTVHEALSNAIHTYTHPFKINRLTESLVGKKPATASKLFAEAMETRLDEISKKTLGNYVSRAGRHNEKIAVRYKELENMEDKLNHVNHRISPEVHGETGSWKQDGELLSGAIKSIRDKKTSLNDKLRKRSEGIYKAVKKLTKEDLDEVEAPANFWNAGMAKMNPIQVSQKQPAEPGQFKATLTKSPKRLADQGASLEGKPRAVRDETESVATARGPKTIELTGDWEADVPDHQFDPKLDSETEYYPLFSQFKSLGAYPSGPARAWESEEIDEDELNEISKKALGRYIERAANSKMMAGVRSQEAPLDSAEEKKQLDKIKKRSHGIARAVKRLTKEDLDEDELNEISKKTLSKYVDVAADKLAGHAYLAGGGSGLDKEGKTKEFRKAVNRLKGIKLANKKLSEDSASLMATATKDEKKAAAQDKKKPAEFKKLHDKHEAEVKNKMKELGEEALDENYEAGDVLVFTDKSRKHGRDFSEKRIGIVSGPTPDGKKLLYHPYYREEFNKNGHLPTGTGSFDPAEVGKKPYGFHTHVEKVGHHKVYKGGAWQPKPGDSAYDLMHDPRHMREQSLEEGLFDPGKHELLALWDEHARRSDAHGSGSRNEILKRIEDHVAKKHGQEGLKKMKLHTDLTNALKHSLSPDKGHLQSILGNMRSRCSMGA